MFKQFFGLTFNPFDKGIDVDKLYQCEDLTELEGRLKYMLDNRGIGLIHHCCSPYVLGSKKDR